MFLRCFAFLLSFFLAAVGHSQQSHNEFHVTEEGQTLYSIALMYEVNVHDVMDCNDVLVKNGLSVGDTVLLDCETLASKDSFSGYHRVQQGETLYSIAKMYGVKVKDIKKWNDLTSSSIEVNKLLKVAEAGTQVNIEWTQTFSPDSMPNALGNVVDTSANSYLSNEKHLFSISSLIGAEMAEGRDTFYIVDYLPQGFALCSTTFSRDSSVYHPLGIAAVSVAVDTTYEWVDLQGVCSSNRNEISRELAETFRSLSSEYPNPWVVLSWKLVVLERTFSEE